MTEARIERAPVDTGLARDHLQRARQFLRDVGSVAEDASGQVLCYSACIASMEAIIAAAGRRVSPGSGYHQKLILECERLTEPDQADLFEAIDEARELRADVSYHAGVISSEEVDHLAAAAAELIAEAEKFVTARE